MATPQPTHWTWRRIALGIAALVVLAALAGSWAGQALRVVHAGRSGVANEHSAGLVVAAERLDFGEVWEDSRFRWTLPIENRGITDVHITDFGGSCSCAAVTPRSLLIPAGETREVSLTLDLAAPRDQPSDEAVRAFEAEIIPKVEGTAAAATRWKVRGKVRAILRLERTDLDFGRLSECAGPLPVQTVSVTSLTPLRGILVRCRSPRLVASVPQREGNSALFELRVAGREPMPVGPFEAEITLIPQTADGRQLPATVAVAQATIVPDVESSPSAVLFGARTIGEHCTEAVTLQSLTGQSVWLKRIKVTGVGLATDQVVPGGGKQIEFLVKQDVMKEGAVEGKVEVEIERQDGKTQTLAIPVSYLGTQKTSP